MIINLNIVLNISYESFALHNRYIYTWESYLKFLKFPVYYSGLPRFAVQFSTEHQFSNLLNTDKIILNEMKLLTILFVK